jgi:choline dehydrogenase-like flavoprotein
VSPAARTEERADVVIVGAGAAGGVYADRLARAGKRVVVLEAGPRWRPGDLYSSQLWARRLKWGGAPVVSGGANPIAHNMIMGSGVGGAALHHYGTWPRVPADGFRMRSTHGRGLDWAFDYETLRPWYDRVQREVGISGDAAAETFRPPGERYPMPPLQTFKHGDLLAAGFRKLGLPVAPLPLIINSVPYAGRDACIYDGWCDAGCPIGALGNPLFTYLRDAEAAGAEVRPNCEALRILTDRQGRADAVEYVERRGTGSTMTFERRVLPARVVVLAASIVQNPRILLNSAAPHHPAGLANSSGLVGAYVMAEAMAFVYGLFEEPTFPYMGVSAGQYTHRPAGIADSRHPEAFGGYQWQIGPAAKPNDIFGIAVTRPDLHGAPLHDFIRRASHHLAYMVGFAGGVPQASNRITLTDTRDAHGMPLARIEHATDAAALRTWRYLLEQGRSAATAAGALEVWTGPQAAGHVTGGTVMGLDPARSVVDGFGRTHDVPNLFAAGAGVFPTCGGVSPTYSIHAMALRSAEHITDRWTDYARVAG